MSISRSGYYKWLKTKDVLNRHQINRLHLSDFIIDIHHKKPSYGYRRINAMIRNTIGWIISDNLVHKCCKDLGVLSKAKHYKKYTKPGEENTIYPNLIKNDWNSNRPFEKVVSDTTIIQFKNKSYDWNYYLDVFNNEIIAYDIRESNRGNNTLNHRKSLEMMLENKIKRGYKDLETISHSDQGAIYTSFAYNNACKDYTIIRSMSRVGTPTDNAVIESINGWLKKEMFIDFNVDGYDNVENFIDDVIYDFNHLRPAYALQYKTPNERRKWYGSEK